MTTRRRFIQTAGAAGAAAVLGASRRAAAQAAGRRPNLLFIHVDQLHADILSGLGCDHVATPNIDRLAASGTLYTNVYAANPVCCPSRSCWYTGRASCETGVVMNEWPIDERLPDLGGWLADAGYASFYAGKWHIPGRRLNQSFQVLTYGYHIGEHGDAATSRAGEAFLHSYDGDRPFFLSVGFLQPHDCCYWVFEHNRFAGELPYPIDDLPPLPANHAFDAAEPEFFQKHWRGEKPHLDWSDDVWRYYLWAYDRQVEMVDAEVGRVLDALEASGHRDDTLVVFSSDHGDGLGRHHMVSKMYLYDEAARVPLIVSWPGELPAGVTDRTTLLSSLDVPATLTDFAGADPLPRARGRSLRPRLEGRAAAEREFVVSEAHRAGRMIRTPEWKLIRYDDSPTQQLFDMAADAGETRNLFADAAHAGTLADLNRRLDDWQAHLEPLPLEGRAPKRG